MFCFIYDWGYLFEHWNAVYGIFYLKTYISSYRIDTLFSIWNCFLALLIIVNPTSVSRVILFLLSVVAEIIYKLPEQPNHAVIALTAFLTIILSYIYLRLKFGSKFDPEKFYKYFAPLVRIELIIVYFWVVVHKINSDFFDITISCATIQLFNIKESLTILPVNDWIIAINPYLTLVIEAVIPVLLIFGKTRLAGLIIAFLFHFMLGFKYTGFTVQLFAFLSLFLTSGNYNHL